MNYNKIILWSVIVAFGGFIFGFDTAVISGAEQEIQNLWNLSDTMIGQTVAMALYGTIIGALLGGFPSEAFGRKKKSLAVLKIYNKVYYFFELLFEF